jgi:acyl carrier protein
MVLETVKKTIANVCSMDVTKVDPQRDMLEYGMDSARAMDLIVSLEDKFDIEISDEVMIGLRTGNDIVMALEQLIV